MFRKTKAVVVVLAVSGTLVPAALAPAGPARPVFADVPADHWAAAAIKAVAADRDWLRDHGDSTFRPEDPLLRRHLARAVIRAFAPSERPGPRFSDLKRSDPFFPSASAAVRLGWMRKAGKRFRPDDQVTTGELDQTLTRALGLTEEIHGLNSIRTADGKPLAHPQDLGERVLAHQLGLHYNHPTSAEARELVPGGGVLRADGAYALWKATAARSKSASLARYRRVVLPRLTPARRTLVEFALSFAGYPYVWAGEWHTATPPGYCCGAQPRGGFDCSGYAWWVLRAASEGWDNSAVRPYAGWALPERSSREMARATTTRLPFEQSRPADLMFFSTRGGTQWKDVDHAGIYLGNGWMIHSAGGVDGVSVDSVKSGWYRDRFLWSRRLVPLGT
ncbi:MAG TPA: NlpC/P60 family protein [Actinomycetota bacterium]|nr:NlpC/P60 family protein [Actinomycetota bacterium]